jgi:hypothetical protein
VALGGGGVEPLAMAVGRRWLAVLERRATDQRGGGGRAPGEAAPGDWSMRRRRARQGGGASGRVRKEAAG